MDSKVAADSERVTVQATCLADVVAFFPGLSDSMRHSLCARYRCCIACNTAFARREHIYWARTWYGVDGGTYTYGFIHEVCRRMARIEALPLDFTEVERCAFGELREPHLKSVPPPPSPSAPPPLPVVGGGNGREKQRFVRVLPARRKR
jgi:hypothetical protein